MEDYQHPPHVLTSSQVSAQIQSLPKDLMCNIFSRVGTFENLATCGCICKRWNGILEPALVALRRCSRLLRGVAPEKVKVALSPTSSPDAHSTLCDLSTIHSFLPVTILSLTLRNCVIFTSATDSMAHPCFRTVLRLHLENCRDMAARSVCSALAQCYQLQDLQLVRCTETGPRFWRALRHCSSLQKLHVEMCDVGETGLAVAGNMENLTHLGLVSCHNVPGAQLQACLERLRQLQSVELKAVAMGDRTEITNFVGAVTRLPELRQLVLDRMRLADANVLQLLPLRERLERLSLQENEELTDVSLEIISHMQGLTNLRLNGCVGITVNGVKHLLHVPSLSQLYLLGCRNLRQAEFNQLHFPPSSFVCI